MRIHEAALRCSSIFFTSLLVACGGSGSQPSASSSAGVGAGTSATTGTESATTSATTGGAGGRDGAGGAVGATTSTTSTTSTTGGGGAAPFKPAPHGPDALVENFGGTVLKSPKVQVISYASDTFAADVDTFVEDLANSSAWAAETAEYGVGPFTKLPTISIAGTPPASQNDNIPNSGNSPFEANLAAQLSGANPAWGTADPDTIYLFLIPAGSNVLSNGSCCSGFLGYHYEAQVGTISVHYGIVCNCGSAKGDPTTPLEWVTTTVSHEIVEASTDPFPGSDAAWAQTDDNAFIWTYATGGELADMCSYNYDQNIALAGTTYEVQRSWSNAASKAGTNPCVPAPATGPYFNSAPVLADTVTINYYGQAVSTKGVKVAKGQSQTIEVQLFSEAPTSGPWTVTAYDLDYYLGLSNSGNTTLTFVETGKATATGSNGTILHLKIDVTSYDSAIQGAGFVLQSDLGMGAALQENLWFAAVGN